MGEYFWTTKPSLQSSLLLTRYEISIATSGSACHETDERFLARNLVCISSTLDTLRRVLREDYSLHMSQEYEECFSPLLEITHQDTED